MIIRVDMIVELGADLVILMKGLMVDLWATHMVVIKAVHLVMLQTHDIQIYNIDMLHFIGLTNDL